MSIERVNFSSDSTVHEDSYDFCQELVRIQVDAVSSLSSKFTRFFQKILHFYFY